MKRLFPMLMGLAFLIPCLGQDIDGMIQVKTFPGEDVGTMVRNAMQICPSAGIPCILVIDHSLSAYVPGTLPKLCSDCYLLDHRNSPRRGPVAAYSYTCTGTDDQISINTILSIGNVYLIVIGNCAASGHIVPRSGDTLNLYGAKITANYGATPDWVIVNHGWISPTARTFTASLTRGSNTLTATNGTFTDTDLDQSLECDQAYLAGYNLNTSVGGIVNRMQIQMIDPSQVTGTSISCTITQRDDGITILGGKIYSNSFGGAAAYPMVRMQGVTNFTMRDVELHNSGSYSQYHFYHSVVMDATNVLLENNQALWDGGVFQYGNDGFDFGGPLRNAREFYDTCSTTDDCTDIFSAGNLYLEGVGRQVAGTVDGVLVEHNSGAAQGAAAVKLFEGCFDSNCNATWPINNVIVAHTESQTSVSPAPATVGSGFGYGLSIVGITMPGNGWNKILIKDSTGKYFANEVNTLSQSVSGTLNIGKLTVVRPLAVNAQSSGYPIINITNSTVSNLNIDAPGFVNAGNYLLHEDANSTIMKLCSNDQSLSDFDLLGDYSWGTDCQLSQQRK